MFSPFGILDSLETSEENCFSEKNPSRGTSIMLPRRFRERFREDSSPFFIVLRSFFVVLWSSTGKFSKSNLSIHSMHPQWSLLVSRALIFISFVFCTLFLTCFNHLFKPFSHLINNKMNFHRSFEL